MKVILIRTDYSGPFKSNTQYQIFILSWSLPRLHKPEKLPFCLPDCIKSLLNVWQKYHLTVHRHKLCWRSWCSRGESFILQGVQNGCCFSSHMRTDDIGRGKGRTKHGSGSGQKLRGLDQADTCVFYSVLATSSYSVGACLRVKHSVCRVDKTLSPDATASRTSQCAAWDMWSERNPLLYFTSSFTTQIQT